MKRKFNRNYQVHVICVVVLMAMSIPYSLGQISFDNVTIQIPNTTSTLGAVEIGDMNNDGLNDVVIAAQQDDATSECNIYIYKQLSEGGFSEPFKLSYPGGYYYISDLEIADLNNDGLNDIAILYRGVVGIFYQQTDGSFSEIENWTGFDNNNGIKCGDLNNDGLIDIIGYSNTSYQILYQKPEGGFSLKTIPTTLTNANAAFQNIIEIGNLDGDGLNDVVKIYASQIEILFQKAGAGVHTDNVIVLGHPDFWELRFSSVTIGDVNNDGKNDIIATCGGNDDAAIMIYYQTDNGVFSNSNSKRIKAYDIPTPIHIVDFNCDGDNEIVVGHDGWHAITTFEKSIAGEYDSYVRYPSLYYSTPFTMAIGDINNDNRSDVVAVGQNGYINILYNTSKPLIFDKIDMKINNLSVKTDTIERIRTVYESIIDLNSVCPRNDFYKYIITDSIENKHYKGDSLKIRHGFLCSEYIDSLEIPFDYIDTKLVRSDTIKSIINLDILEAFVYESNLAANDIENYIYVKSNICWVLSCDQDWLQFNTSSDNKDTRITVTVTPNESEEERIANITITGDNVLPVTMSITQSEASTNGFIDIADNPDFYINSTTKKLIITKTDLGEIIKVKLHDLSGNVVLAENSRNIPTEIDLSSLMQGVYVLTLELSGRRVEHKILIR